MYEIEPPTTAAALTEIVDAPLVQSQRRIEFLESMIQSERGVVQWTLSVAIGLFAFSILLAPVLLSLAFFTAAIAAAGMVSLAWDVSLHGIHSARVKQLTTGNSEDHLTQRVHVESYLDDNCLVREIHVGDVYWCERQTIDLDDEAAVAITARWLADETLVRQQLRDGSYIRPLGAHQAAVQALVTTHQDGHRELTQ
jgi:hypothetical protein